MTVTGIEIPKNKIAKFCEHWNITEFAVFGSVLREDFSDDSDIDVLATFGPNSRRTLLDEAQMELDLETIFGRKVDLLSWSAVENSPNWIRRNRILSTAVTVYAKR